MKRLMTLLLAFFAFNAFSTEVVKYEFPREKIHLTIVRVGVETFYTVKMENFNRIEMDLICGTDFAHSTQRPVIRYRNYYNQIVADFEFDKASTCYDLKDNLQATFEGINEDRPLRFELDPKTKKVTKIIYPEIAPYYEGPDHGLQESESRKLD